MLLNNHKLSQPFVSQRFTTPTPNNSLGLREKVAFRPEKSSHLWNVMKHKRKKRVARHM